MKWSYQIGSIAGAPIYMHATALLWLGWAALSICWSGEPSAADPISIAPLVLVSALLHEMGHAVAAKRQGIGVKCIVVSPVAGYAWLKKMPESPAQERAIIKGGLMVTLALAVFGFVASFVLIWQHGPDYPFFPMGTLFVLNMVLFVLNVLPIFPLDGGKILRSYLAEVTDQVSATWIAAVLGIIGSGVILYLTWQVASFWSLIWILVALGAVHELSHERARALLQGIPAHTLMQTEFHTVAPYDTVAEVATRLPEEQKVFPVVKDDKVVGILSREAMQRALENGRGNLPVCRVMCRDVDRAEVTDTLDGLYFAFGASDVHTLVVMRGDELVGLLLEESVDQLIEQLRRPSAQAPEEGS